MNNKKVYLFK